MKLVRGAWKLLVGIKDGLVLIAMLLFFALLFAALSARPGMKAIKDGALVLDLDGTIVEQPEEQSAFASLSGRTVAHQFRTRDVLRAIRAAKGDARVKALVLDLDSFGGGYPATLNENRRRDRRGPRERQAGAGLCHRLYRRGLSTRRQCQRDLDEPARRDAVQRPPGVTNSTIRV